MEIDVDIDNIDGIKSCKNCGVVVNWSYVKMCPDNEEWQRDWICPVCKFVNHGDIYD